MITIDIASLEAYGRLGDALALTRADLADAMFWIRQYVQYLEKGITTDRDYFERGLERRKRDYTRMMREAHGMELRYADMGGEFVG